MSDTDSTQGVGKEQAPTVPAPPRPEPHQTADQAKPPAGPPQARKPQIGDSRPAPVAPGNSAQRSAATSGANGNGQGNGSGGGQSGSQGGAPGANGPKKRRRRRGKGGGQPGGQASAQGGQTGSGNQPRESASGGSSGGRGANSGNAAAKSSDSKGQGQGQSQRGQNRGGGQRGRQGGNQRRAPEPVELELGDDDAVELDEKTLKKRSGKSRKGRAVGRYQMNVHVAPDSTQISILEGRALLEHYVSRPADDVSQIHGNIYVGRVENVLPGMEAAFIDIATPKNAVLYRGDVQYDPDDIVESGEQPRIEDVLKPKQLILCQVTKNPIAHKGARLTQEVSLAGRFVVLVPNSKTYGISKRLPDDERRRLRKLLDRVKPEQHGLIVRTAASGVTTEEVERDILRLLKQWSRIEELASKQDRPGLVYREPELAVRFIREEFNADYRAVYIDDKDLYLDVQEYVEAVAPALSDRVKFYDRSVESLSLFDRYHISEQVTKTLDRKVWLPSGGSLIIEATEALTVIDVNTGRNVGSSSLEETVFKNNLEAADEIARQLRLRDIGGIIVIDFIDMEVKENRDQVVKRFREALSRDKTRTQV
ncbi:MAG: Rne/Rng family ribonuclease, partial [Microthrixaceae bacterium]|nr:Rne/Rng family ribonuclease [Microthrixaceae bacterium]